MSFLISNQDLS